MRTYLQRSIETALREIFPADDAETALSWWIASEGRAPVIVVGSGYTRNARDRVLGNRIAPSHVPLWPDVLQRFEEDLGSDAGGLDALTLAELHSEELGPRRHVDVLLEMLPDERLAPGPAHEALFDLRPAAIITPNFLDTVLDRHPRAVPIFDDASAAVRVDPRERTEIVYVHGHRSAPATWVLTRSQFDRLEESRPILLTRIRQLFAQHPILTVGFSLADPDFHLIQGQINARMGGYQPLGLTLLGSLGSPDRASRRESALRRHWEKRNLRIVRFKEGVPFEASLCSFLRLPGKMEIATCEKFLRAEQGFRKRVELARSVLHDADADKRIDTEYGWQETLWRTCLDADFSGAERSTFRERVNASAQAGMPGPVRRVSAADPGGTGRAAAPRLSTALLNDGPGFGTWELAWLCDGWWGSGRDKGALVDWLHERIVHGDWPMNASGGGSDIRIAELLILLIESLPADARTAHAGRERDALRLLRRYDPETAKRLGERFLGLEDGLGPGPADQFPDIAREMAEGFRASMNGDHVRATDAYDRAFKPAQRASDPLGLWLAARSRYIAHELQDTAPRHSSNDEKDRLSRKYLAEAREAERHPKVAEWQRAADQRILNLRKLTIDDLREERRRRTFEGMHARFSDVEHLAWRTLRDLEEASAHPVVQIGYLQPLLDHGFGEIAYEASHRLSLDIEGFREWSRHAIEDDGASHDRATYDGRSEALVSAWLSVATNDPSITVLVGCINAVRALPPYVRTMDVDKIREVLTDAPRVLASGVSDPSFGPGAVKTFNGTTDTTAALAQAWSAWLGMRGTTEDFAAFKTWANELRPRDLFDPIHGAHRIRWESLVHAGVPVDDIIMWLCSGERTDWLKTAHRSRFGERAAVLLWRLAGLRPQSLSEPVWETLTSAITSLLPDSADTMVGALGIPEGDDLLRAGFGVLAAWEKSGTGPSAGREKPKALRALYERLHELAQAFFLLLATGGYAPALIVAQVSVAADFIRYDRAVASAEIQALETRLDAGWPTVLAFCKNNHGEVTHVVDFLATTIETRTASSSTRAQGRILELIGVSSAGFEGLTRILDSELWGADTWAQLTQLVREAASGARGRFPGSARANVCDLTRHAVLHTHAPLPPDLQFLVHHMMEFSANEDASVANHGAYALMTVAEWGIAPSDSVLAGEIAGTLRSIATDPRPNVRSAAAYALGFVGRSSHAVIRELVSELASLAGDPYAAVHAEWWLGQRPSNNDGAPAQNALNGAADPSQPQR